MDPKDELATKLDVLIRLYATQLVGEKSGSEAIATLAKAGLDNNLIAELVGTTPATVRSARAKARKPKPRKK